MDFNQEKKMEKTLSLEKIPDYLQEQIDELHEKIFFYKILALSEKIRTLQTTGVFDKYDVIKCVIYTHPHDSDEERLDMSMIFYNKNDEVVFEHEWYNEISKLYYDYVFDIKRLNDAKSSPMKMFMLSDIQTPDNIMKWLVKPELINLYLHAKLSEDLPINNDKIVKRKI